jgi:hypothetical protein
MFTELTLGDLERVRLILRGGTVIDWRRLSVSSINDCNFHMPVITIWGQYGSSSAETRVLIARMLNMDYKTGEIIAHHVQGCGETG